MILKFLKIIVTVFLLVLFGGCMQTPKPSKKVDLSKKAFEQEDAYILFALRAEQLKDYDSASKLFDELYEKSKKTEYLHRSLKDNLLARRYQKVISRIKELPQEMKEDDFEIIRMEIFALVGLGKLDKARISAIKLVEKTKKANDYILVSEIYVKQKKFNTALKYLESAYTKEYDEHILDQMAIVLYVNLHRKKDAIAQLETHSRVNGCSELVCKRLIGFYSNENDIDGLLSVYLRLYDLKKSDEVAKRVIQIYNYKKDYVKLMQFLEKTGSADDILLQIYINFKNYKKASLLAQKLYEEDGDLNYLGQSAIFEYESAKDKNDKNMQERVVKRLKEVVATEKIPLYLNYLGYLLIDHSIDVKNGMKYVREALEIEGDSAYYLDSLAWGYYKLGECTKAYTIIKKANSLEGGDDPEVLEHIKTIEKCKTIKKGKI